MIHPSAIVEEGTDLGEDVFVWAFTHVRTGVTVGDSTSIGSHCYIDTGVSIGERCKIQTGARLFHGVTVDDGVFVGPGCIVTNDLRPRAIGMDRELKADDDWVVTRTHIGAGASLGAGSVIVAGADVGSYSFVGAGSIVTRPVAAHAIVVGNPARQIGWACHCGETLKKTDEGWRCPVCNHAITIPSE